MDAERFEGLVGRALDALPDEFAERMETGDGGIQDKPTAAQRRSGRTRRGDLLLGLYEGIPLTERGQGYTLVPPDKITIFQRAIEEYCGENDDSIADEIGRVVRHEIAHHFGISDARLDELEKRDSP